jgi:hypothetical protein
MTKNELIESNSIAESGRLNALAEVERLRAALEEIEANTGLRIFDLDTAALRFLLVDINQRADAALNPQEGQDHD